MTLYLLQIKAFTTVPHYALSLQGCFYVKICKGAYLSLPGEEVHGKEG